MMIVNIIIEQDREKCERSRGHRELYVDEVCDLLYLYELNINVRLFGVAGLLLVSAKEK